MKVVAGNWGSKEEWMLEGGKEEKEGERKEQWKDRWKEIS